MYTVHTLVFFVCKQQTAYEMRISDWSSDVCSSDLLLMPDLSTSAESVGRFCVLFLLAVRPLRASFPLSDDRDVEPPGHEGWLQDRPEENGPDRRGRGPIPGHGTRQFPRVEANQIGQESRDRKSTRLNSSH